MRIAIANTCVHNWGWASYSICRSLTGCCPSREAIAPQGTAVGADMSQPFRLFGDYSSSIAHGVAIEHYLSRHSVPDSNTASFDGMQSLKGSYIYCLWHRHWQMATTTHTTSLKGSDRFEDEICRSLTGCRPSRRVVAPQGAARRVNLLQPFRLSGDYSSSIAQCVAIEHYLSRHSVPDSNTASFDGMQSLKGSYIYCLWHRHWQMATTTHTTSLKGSNRYTLRHRRRFSMASPLASLKGSDRFELNHSCNI